jgi:Ssp1 endopeptidase immunity protein Rap1a
MSRFIALAIGLLVATTAHAMKGDELARLMDGYTRVQGAKSPSREDELGGAAFIAYIRGVEDSMNGVRFCITAQTSSAQQVAFIVKYIKAHPEEWHNSATTLIVQALQPAYPCAAQ